MTRAWRLLVLGLLAATLAGTIVSSPLFAQDAGRAVYDKRCVWCHGPDGDGNGPSAAGMFPRPRNFVEAEYKVRSTAHGQLPTDEDLVRMVSNGLPGTPMPPWKAMLSDEEARWLAEFMKTESGDGSRAP